MAGRPKLDLGLTGYDELFMTDEERQESKLPRIYDIPIEMIDDFPGHPYKVRIDEDMQQLVESIKERGILTPVTLRQKDDGRYETVSGHRRKKACELAGLPTVRAEVRDMTRDEAIIYMVESNFQRSQILPSEKAFSYKMRLEAMSRQGKRTDLTSNPVGGKLGESASHVREPLFTGSIARTKKSFGRSSGKIILMRSFTLPALRQWVRASKSLCSIIAIIWTQPCPWWK